MRQNLSGSTGMGLGVGGGCAAIVVRRNGSASGGGVQHVPATCQPRPAAGDGRTVSISGDKELPHLVRTC